MEDRNKAREEAKARLEAWVPLNEQPHPEKSFTCEGCRFYVRSLGAEGPFSHLYTWDQFQERFKYKNVSYGHVDGHKYNRDFGKICTACLMRCRRCNVASTVQNLVKYGYCVECNKDLLKESKEKEVT